MGRVEKKKLVMSSGVWSKSFSSDSARRAASWFASGCFAFPKGRAVLNDCGFVGLDDLGGGGYFVSFSVPAVQSILSLSSSSRGMGSCTQTPDGRFIVEDVGAIGI